MNAIRRAIDQVVSWFRPVRLDAPLQGSRHLDAGEFTADGPQFGVEIFNDDKTPMEFVVDALQSALDMTYDSAVAAMLHIHHKGSVLLPADNLAHAERVANAITAMARNSKHPLVCRAASANKPLEAIR